MRQNGKSNLKWAGLAVLALGIAIGGAFTLVSFANNDAISVNDGGTVNIYNGQVEGALGGTTNLGTLELSEDLIVGDDLTVTDDANIADVLQYGGVENDWIEGSCTDASTTILAVVNPWGAAAYVDKVIINITGAATTPFTMDVGTSSTAFAAPSEVVVDDTGLATSTTGNFFNTSGTLTGVGGYTDPGTNSQDVFTWASGEYIVGTVTTVNSAFDAAFTNAANTFVCTYKIHSFK